MIIMNAIGMIVFISNFNGVFIFQDLESSRQIQKMSVLSQKCLPLLQDGGLNKAEIMKKLSDIILKETAVVRHFVYRPGKGYTVAVQSER